MVRLNLAQQGHDFPRSSEMPTQAGNRKIPEPSAMLLTIAATAVRLGCSDDHVYRLIAAGELEAVDIAQPGAKRAKTRVSETDLSSYIRSRTRRVGRSRAPQPAT
jgi:excisionase family DNA binding protein